MEAIYTVLMVLSICIGPFIKKIEGFHTKRVVCMLLGLIIVIILAQDHILHHLFMTLVNCVVIKTFGPKTCHIASFIWCFGYLFTFRITYYGLYVVPPHANAIQMYLTLKLVGVAFEVHDSLNTKAADDKEGSLKKEYHSQNINLAEDEEASLKKEYQDIDPSSLDMFMYAFCYLGVVAGPYYKYRT